MFGPQAAYFAELFGPRLRYSGFAFARELGSIIAGGPSPFIAAVLVGWMAGAPWGVACYVIFLSLITAFAIWCGPETHHSDIRADTPGRSCRRTLRCHCWIAPEVWIEQREAGRPGAGAGSDARSDAQ